MRAVIDLRSDTVTRPTAAMRRAMAEAQVGDDVYGDDPTVNRLQDRVAELVGMEAALFVPSGSMANQIAVRVHTRPGDEVLAGAGAHTYLFESGAASALAGVQMTLLAGDGRFTGADVRAAYKPDDHHRPPSALVLVENTHNVGGGILWHAAAQADVLATARELGLRAHLDGARLWNAAAATGKSEKELAAGFDSVSVCLSKGLGAPIGSLVAGTRDFIRQAHRFRKMYGGAMRQAGILAAAGLHALEHHRARLTEDHESARLLAEALAGRGFEIDLGSVETNIVMAEMTGGRAAVLADRAAEHGVLLNAFGDRRIRLVTHLDVDRDACQRAAEILIALAGDPS
jgi:threonine aldolase